MRLLVKEADADPARFLAQLLCSLLVRMEMKIRLSMPSTTFHRHERQQGRPCGRIGGTCQELIHYSNGPCDLCPSLKAFQSFTPCSR